MCNAVSRPVATPSICPALGLDLFKGSVIQPGPPDGDGVAGRSRRSLAARLIHRKFWFLGPFFGGGVLAPFHHSDKGLVPFEKVKWPLLNLVDYRT
jgi:hypothetical protein